jgi:hypothetical protein
MFSVRYIEKEDCLLCHSTFQEKINKKTLSLESSREIWREDKSSRVEILFKAKTQTINWRDPLKRCDENLHNVSNNDRPKNQSLSVRLFGSITGVEINNLVQSSRNFHCCCCASFNMQA